MDKKLLGILVAMLLISIVVLPEKGQGDISGPVMNPPFGVGIDDSETLPPNHPDYGEQWGRDGGRTMTFTVFQVSKYSQLIWEPTDIGLAFDGAIETEGEILTYDSIVEEKAVWLGNTQVEVLDETTGVYELHPVDTKFILTVKDASDSLIPFEFVDGMPVVNLKALEPNLLDEVIFTATLEMIVQVPPHDSITEICPYAAEAFSEGEFLPALDVFDCLQTNPDNERPAISMFEYGFFYELSNECDLCDHAAYMEELVGDVQDSVDDVYAWTNFLYTDWPLRIQGINTAHMDINDNIAVVEGKVNHIDTMVDAISADIDTCADQDSIDEIKDILNQAPDWHLLMFGLGDFITNPELQPYVPVVIANSPLYQSVASRASQASMDSVEDKLDALTSQIGEIAAEVYKLDIEIFQMNEKGECVYHIGASIGGLPVEIDIAEVYAVRDIKNQDMVFESLSESDYELSSFGIGHLRVCMSMSKDFPAKDAIMFQFIFVNPDTGIQATVLALNEIDEEEN